MNSKTKRIVTISMLCAITYLVMAVGRIPVVLFLKYDPSDIVVTLGGLIWGPMTAFTVSGVILIVILFAVVIYQIVEISVLSERRSKLRQEYEQTLERIEEGSEWLENYELNKDAIMYQLALQNGYRPR